MEKVRRQILRQSREFDSQILHERMELLQQAQQVIPVLSPPPWCWCYLCGCRHCPYDSIASPSPRGVLFSLVSVQLPCQGAVWCQDLVALGMVHTEQLTVSPQGPVAQPFMCEQPHSLPQDSKGSSLQV